MVYIWVRATANWEDERAFLAQLDPAFKAKVEVWDDTFDMPFHEFRRETRRIAERNLSQVENAAVAGWNEIPQGALVIPVDDDDWFAPYLARVIEESLEPGRMGCSWTSSFVEVPINLGHRLAGIRRAIFPRTPPRWICSTNNYAIVKVPETKPLLEKHTVASGWFEGAGRGQVQRIERRLSAMNRTLGSRTSLGFGKPTIRRSELLRKFRRYRALYRAPVSHELEWCRPYLALMAELMDRLNIKGSRPRS